MSQTKETGEQQPTTTRKKAQRFKTVAGVKIVVDPKNKGFVHALVEKGPRFSSVDGARLSKPYIHMTEPKNWNLTKDSFSRIGLTVHDVYVPK